MRPRVLVMVFSPFSVLAYCLAVTSILSILILGFIVVWFYWFNNLMVAMALGIKPVHSLHELSVYWTVVTVTECILAVWALAFGSAECRV